MSQYSCVALESSSDNQEMQVLAVTLNHHFAPNISDAVTTSRSVRYKGEKKIRH